MLRTRPAKCAMKTACAQWHVSSKEKVMADLAGQRETAVQFPMGAALVGPKARKTHNTRP